MKPVTQTPTPPSEFVRRLDSVRMHSFDRLLAKEHMRQAEATVDLLVEAMRVIRTTAAAWKERFLAPANRQRDEYFAGALDRIDLEQRMRNWERRPTPFRDSV